MPAIASHLDQIIATTRRDLAQRKHAVPLRTLADRAQAHTPRGFVRALRAQAERGPAVIAELKKASPSKGLIRADFDTRSLATEMQDAGAAALSVLTDEPFFQGSLANLQTASAATTLPCLRKDFVVDEYQVLEARAYGADAILLIAAALTDGELDFLASAAHALALDVLCEVHTREEAERVANLPADAVGVNNRDLRTFEVKLENSLSLVEHLPSGALRVAESGIRTPLDYARLRAAGFEAFLIGEAFMAQAQPGPALARWMAQCAALTLQGA